MNNNQDNFNVNPQMNNSINNQNPVNQPIPQQDQVSGFNQNNNEPLNVIPQNVTFTNQKSSNQGFSSVPNNNIQTNPMINSNNIFYNNDSISNTNQNEFTEENPMLTQTKNRFFNNDIDTSRTTLNGLENMNVEGDYNNMPKVDYTLDPKVQENLQQQKEPQKNTITITSEMKVFFIIFIVLLLFVFAAPTIYDMIREIKY